MMENLVSLQLVIRSLEMIPQEKSIFDDLMEKKDLSYESFEIKKEATVKKLEYQTIILDEIEIKVPISEILKVKEKYLPDGKQMIVDFEDRKLKSLTPW